MTQYEEIYCPECGHHINSLDVIDVANANPESHVTCYWCKRRHSIDYVPICRHYHRQWPFVAADEKVRGAVKHLTNLLHEDDTENSYE